MPWPYLRTLSLLGLEICLCVAVHTIVLGEAMMSRLYRLLSNLLFTSPTIVDPRGSPGAVLHVARIFYMGLPMDFLWRIRICAEQ